jgi:hypothetical protein
MNSSVYEGDGQVMFRRLRDYIVSKRLVGPDGRIHADDLLGASFSGRSSSRAASARAEGVDFDVEIVETSK